jgi:protein-S-isoprenylcysteine O-methyltransferase Ste14
MATTDTTDEDAKYWTVADVSVRCYRAVAYFGLVSVMASLLFGFRYDPFGYWRYYVFDTLLYLAFIVPHLVFTRAWWKERVWGNVAGHPRERRVYILFTVLTWFALLFVHWPLPGLAFSLPEPLRFAGMVGFLLAMLMFFEGATRASLDGLLGVPGSTMQYSHGEETPLYTEGPYADVRHPMYRAIFLMGGAALIVHPNLAQLFWTLMLGSTFLVFIPVEEEQLLEARGDDYRRYCERTPYRLFRGIW